MPVEVMLSAETIQARIRELAAEIDRDLAGEVPILVAVLKGSVHFFSDLARAMETDAELDFMQTSSYHGGKSSTGVVQIRKDLDINIEGRHVIVVEDIVDTGTTLSHLLELLETRHPKSLKVAALLSKPEALKVEVQVDYLGFDIKNEFVVGYGLDYDERFRNLPYVGILRDE
jgi:hypoxanthine phosphoribosyltransferase